MNTKDEKIFEEACNGFGFEEIEQHPDGTYCTGCNTVHKRPTKMYKGGPGNKEILCKFQVILLYNPEE